MTQKNQTRGSCDILYQLLNTDSSSQDIKLRFFVQSIIIVARYIYHLMIRPGIVSVLFCSVMSSFGTDWQLELGGGTVSSASYINTNQKKALVRVSRGLTHLARHLSTVPRPPPRPHRAPETDNWSRGSWGRRGNFVLTPTLKKDMIRTTIVLES